MKTLIPVIAATVALLFASGCASLTPEEKVTEIADIANLAAYAGAGLHLAEHPEDVTYFQASVAALDSLIKAQDYQPSTLASALKQLPLTELQGRKGSVYVSSAVMLWDKATRRLINLDTTGAVKEVAVAIRAGLAQAIAETPQSPQ